MYFVFTLVLSKNLLGQFPMTDSSHQRYVDDGPLLSCGTSLRERVERTSNQIFVADAFNHCLSACSHHSQ
jgi:hypothetical protein